MIKGLINWLISKKDQVVQGLAIATPKASPKPVVKTNKTYLVDASEPLYVINETITANILPMRAIGETTGGQTLGSIPQQALALRQIVNNALAYMKSKSPKTINKWASTSALNLYPRAGQDINAYYDRSSLKFFYFKDTVRGKNIFACDSRSVVAHEFGHAFLDIIRPDLWSLAAPEVWAFHEAFGDITALISSLQFPQLIDKALADTGSDLTKSNVISRLAIDMGVGLYNLTNGADGELSNCLRDLSIKFQYVKPETLPTYGPDNILINESHNFSRVFSSMFYDLLLRIMKKNITTGQSAKIALTAARDTITSYFLQACTKAAASTRFFKSVCQEMLLADQRNGNKYQQIMTQCFTDSKITTAPIAMLRTMSLEDVLNNIKDEYEIDDEDVIVVRTTSSKTIKLVDEAGILALHYNPLLSVEVEVAAQSAYFFSPEGQLEHVEKTTHAEVVEAALNCLNQLNVKNLVGNHDKAIFEVIDNKLVRKQIACSCNKPNYCIPGSPEYQKPWKPKNNSGCIKCGKGCEPKPCDCASPPVPAPPKIGCYTKVSTGGITKYSVGSSISRKVC